MPLYAHGAHFFERIENNTIPATAFKAIKAPRKPGEREENETEKGLRVADTGFMNTAVIKSDITYIDGEAGSKFWCLFNFRDQQC